MRDARASEIRTGITGMALAAALLAAPAALAHGEAEPGPHGGEIRMPGAFHTEVVAGEDNLRVYLLDMQFGNPQTQDSSVQAVIRAEGGSRRLDCRAEDEAFRCPLPEGISLDAGELEVSAVRGGGQLWRTSYDLPLAFDSARGGSR